MPACPECLYGVGRLDEKCGHCGSALDLPAAQAAEAERARLVPKPPFLIGELVVPVVLCLGGIAAIISGAFFALNLPQEIKATDTAKLTVLVANGASCLLFGVWSILRQKTRATIVIVPTAEPGKGSA